MSGIFPDFGSAPAWAYKEDGSIMPPSDFGVPELTPSEMNAAIDALHIRLISVEKRVESVEALKSYGPE